MALRIRGTIVPDGVERDVFMSDGKVTFETTAEVETILDGGYLLPGLVDAHAHLSFASPADDDAAWPNKASASAALQLEAGVLVIRDLGGIDGAVSGVSPSVGLPRVFTANRFLAAAASDAHLRCTADALSAAVAWARPPRPSSAGCPRHGGPEAPPTRSRSSPSRRADRRRV